MSEDGPRYYDYIRSTVQLNGVTIMPIPQVPKPGGGTQERDRNEDGAWRRKRKDAGKKRRRK